MSEIHVEVAPAIVDDTGRARRAAHVSHPTLGSRDLWFEHDAELVEDVGPTADPFALALLSPAMRDHLPLRVVGAPVSPSLLANLDRFMEVWRAWRGYGVVAVHADEEERPAMPGPGLLSFSGGIDSAYSAWEHTTGRAGPQTIALGAGVFVHGFDIPLVDVAGYDGALARSRRMLESVGLRCIAVATNMRDLLSDWEEAHGLAIASVLHALRRGSSTGMIASSATYDLPFLLWGSTPLTDPLLSSDSFRIVHDGCGANRFEKLAALTKWDDAMEHLRFCWAGPRRDGNCGECRKCNTVAALFRILDVEPRCFDHCPSAEQIAEQFRREGSMDGFSRLYTRVTYDAAVAHGVDEAWVRELRQRLRRDRYAGLVNDLAAPVSRRVDRWRTARGR